jgi:hypothetical protein
VKQFVRNPGEVLGRVREQLRGEGDDTKVLSARRDDLAKRLAAKQSQKDRYIRLYAQGHISDTELDTYLADLKNQISNLRLLIESAEADLSHGREQAQLADTTYAWLTALRKRVEEIEADTPDAFLKRQQLVRLLVDRITVGRGESGETTVEITYRFGPPNALGEEDGFAGNLQNSLRELGGEEEAFRDDLTPLLHRRAARGAVERRVYLDGRVVLCVLGESRRGREAFRVEGAFPVRVGPARRSEVKARLGR